MAMTPTQRTALAFAIRLRQAQRQSRNGTCAGHDYTDELLDAADESLELARASGCLPEYLASLESVPVLAVTVANLDAPARKKHRWCR